MDILLFFLQRLDRYRCLEAVTKANMSGSYTIGRIFVHLLFLSIIAVMKTRNLLQKNYQFTWFY